MDKKGHWFPLDETPADLALKGLPRQGDIVVIEYDEKYSILTATIRRKASLAETNKDAFRARETGSSFIFSPLFGY